MTEIHIHNHDSGHQPTSPTWDTEALQRDFEVRGFWAPYVSVTRRSDGKKGLLEFQHGPPRVYWGFKPVS